MDEEAIAQAQHHCEHQHRVVVAHPAAVVVVGDIQTLMQTAFSMPQASRFRRIQFAASSREGSTLVISATSSIFAAFGLAQQAERPARPMGSRLVQR